MCRCRASFTVCEIPVFKDQSFKVRFLQAAVALYIETTP
jgi:hypothetical protein